MHQASNSSIRLQVVGALHVDEIATPEDSLHAHASNPVRWHRRMGGVAANAARIASQRVHTSLIASVGNDDDGRQLVAMLLASGVHASIITLEQHATGRYTVVLDSDGELFIGLADVSHVENLNLDTVRPHLADERIDAVLIDANLSARCIEQLVPWVRQAAGSKIIALTVSPNKANRWRSSANHVDLLFCNRAEAASLGKLPIDSSMQEFADKLSTLGFQRFIITDGPEPLLLHDADVRTMLDVPTVQLKQAVNGAGDTFAGATTAAWISGQTLIDSIVHSGLPAAAAVLRGEWAAPAL